MGETYKKMNEKIAGKKGAILIISTVILGVLLTLATYFLSFTLTDFKISGSQVAAAQAYYLAEAGINEAIWRLKNDSDWQAGFEDSPGCSSWGDSFLQQESLLEGASYEVSIQNSECAKGEIVATSTISIDGSRNSQRVIKTKAFKAIGSLTEDSGIFSGGSSENVDINASVIDVYDGNIFSGNKLQIKLFSEVDIFDNASTTKLEGKALSEGNLIVDWSFLNAEAKCSKDICEGDCTDQGCPPVKPPMPMVDFDSEETTSYKNQAQAAEDAGNCSVLCNSIECDTKCIYTENEFEDLLWQVGEGGTLTLNSNITYVTGKINLEGERKLEINGVLLADKTINIGEKNCFKKGSESQCGFDQLMINDPGDGIPSGIITKSKLNIGPYSSFQDFSVTGLIYANDEARLTSIPDNFTITGGLLARKVSIVSAWATLKIYLDNDIIAEGIWGGDSPPEGGSVLYSPVVTIEHWEESY